MIDRGIEDQKRIDRGIEDQEIIDRGKEDQEIIYFYYHTKDVTVLTLHFQISHLISIFFIRE